MSYPQRRHFLLVLQFVACVIVCFSVSLYRSLQVANHVQTHHRRSVKSTDFWMPKIIRASKDRFVQLHDLIDSRQAEKRAWHENLPPLDQMIVDDKEDIVGSVKHMLDFAILGHAKCATSFLMKWLSAHSETQIWEYEVCTLSSRKPANLVKKLYNEMPTGAEYKRGYKCPGHFSRNTLRYYRSFFSNAGIIVGLRHPVRWFESYYNFRVRRGINELNWTMPHANKLIGECPPEAHGVCTNSAQFHSHLSMFGKTNMSDPVEQALLSVHEKYGAISPIRNRVFVYEIAQLYDDSAERRIQFQRDLQHFLGLSQPFPAAIVPTKGPPKEKAINICDDEFTKLRQELLAVGKRASIWIRQYFLKSDEVYVSNMEHFESIVEQWEHDPCIKIETEE